jgi:hypothetical protein
MKSTPSDLFLGAILRGYDTALAMEQGPITCGVIWNYVCGECLSRPDGFREMFAWDTTRAKHVNRIGTIQECIARGLVPHLRIECVPGKRSLHVVREATE